MLDLRARVLVMANFVRPLNTMSLTSRRRLWGCEAPFLSQRSVEIPDMSIDTSLIFTVRAESLFHLLDGVAHMPESISTLMTVLSQKAQSDISTGMKKQECDPVDLRLVHVVSQPEGPRREGCAVIFLRELRVDLDCN